MWNIESFGLEFCILSCLCWEVVEVEVWLSFYSKEFSSGGESSWFWVLRIFVVIGLGRFCGDGRGGDTREVVGEWS